MKHLISHRGNLIGPQPDRENHPDYIIEALKAGFEVELDVWMDGTTLYLGHDGPQYPIEHEYLYKPGLWCHAKNLRAFEALLSKLVHCFWHDLDDVTLTSRGMVWTRPGRPLIKNSIYVAFGPPTEPAPDGIAGVCSDHILLYRDYI